MLGAAVFYMGLVTALSGLALVVKPIRRLGLPTRSRAAIVVAAGALLAAVGLILEAPESRVARAKTHLDGIVPVWQFGELGVRATPLVRSSNSPISPGL